ncbi:VC0807 family protein [Nocardia miyunensis]|uniref:VC0807 family protein n=1 Tax=Nocardia miyunensis TaxID=282684 RepID=UPI000833BD88|nr:VC0807 family protein [Nocardia miyunensis]
MTAADAAPIPNRRAIARQMLRDIGAPLITYYALHALGVSNLIALGAGTVVSGLFVLVEVVRKRKIDFFAGVILTGFVVGFAITFISGDARFMLAKDSVVTGLIGLAFLVSAVVGKPLVYLAARSGASGSDPAKAAAFEERYRTRPTMRRAFSRLSAMWGAGLLAEAALRVVLVYQLPVSTMVWLSTVMMVVTFALLMGISLALGRRWKAAAERADAAALAA